MTMVRDVRAQAIAGFVALAFLVMFGFVGRIPQNPAFHEFCDTRSFIGIPNALNVLSNLAFLVVGALGLSWLYHRPHSIDWQLAPAYAVFFAGLVATAFGSGYYHWAPNNEALFWDRLPIAVAFMALFATVLAERISLVLTRAWIPLTFMGAASVVLWQLTDDLRLYGLVQFLPIVLIPVMLCLFPARWTGGWHLMAAIGAYMIGKLFEDGDQRLFALLGQTVSGHTSKHLIAAFGAWLVYRMLTQRERIAPASQI